MREVVNWHKSNRLFEGGKQGTPDHHLKQKKGRRALLRCCPPPPPLPPLLRLLLLPPPRPLLPQLQLLLLLRCAIYAVTTSVLSCPVMAVQLESGTAVTVVLIRPLHHHQPLLAGKYECGGLLTRSTTLVPFLRTTPLAVTIAFSTMLITTGNF